MAVRIKDVARKAGVSVTTVSRVLNNEKYVTDELKKKVLAAIEELDYSPNHIARSLVRKKTNLIGVIVPDLASSFYSTILSSVEEAASENGYNLLVCNIIEDTDKELKYLNVFQEMRVEGIIIMHEKINNEIKHFLDRSNIPVIFSSVKPVNRKFHSVIIDDYRAAYEATEYLVSLGHSRIGFIGGDMRDITSGQNRYAAYRNALAAYEIPILYEYIKFGDYKLQSGYAIMEELLQCDPMPTAVFAVSDDMALGAMNCISDHQLQVPEHISIIGFDGSPFTEIIRPRLTSMQQPIQQMGKESVKALLSLISEPSALNQDIILQHELVVRDSTRKIK